MMASPQESNTNKELDKCLPIIFKCLQMFKNKIIFLYSIGNFILFASLALGVSVYGLIHPTKTFWLIYGQIPLGCVLLNIQLMICFIYFYKWEQAKVIYSTQFSWDLETLPLEAKNKIVYTGKQTETGFIVACSLIICTTIAILKQITPVLWHLVSALAFMEEYVPHFRWIVISVIWINSQYMGFMTIIALYYLFVPVTLTRIQLIMLYSMAHQFKKSTPKQRSHKYVEENLKNIIERHQNILRIHAISKKNAFIPLFLITISLLLSISYNTILFHSPYCGTVSPIIPYFVTLILAAYFCYQGQSFEDQYEDFFTLLYNLNWYEWNINNMKTFKILFLNSSVPISEIHTALFQINYSYFKKSIKVIYVLINFQSIKVTYTIINLARTFSHQ